MKRLMDVADRSLEWSQPKATRASYELRAGEDLVATLEFRNSFGSLATGASADGRWTFKRQGFFRPVVTVRQEGNDVEIGQFHHQTWRAGGTIDLSADRRLLVSTSFWQTRYEITTPAEDPLITFTRLKASSTSGMHIHGAVDAGIAVAAMLGWSTIAP